MTNPCNAASLQGDMWIQDLQCLKQRSAFAFHTLLCVTRRCQTVYSAVHCQLMAIASMPKYQKQLKHVCLVMNWNKSHLHCHACQLSKASFLILCWLREGSTMMMMITSLVAWT